MKVNDIEHYKRNMFVFGEVFVAGNGDIIDPDRIQSNTVVYDHKEEIISKMSLNEISEESKRNQIDIILNHFKDKSNSKITTSDIDQLFIEPSHLYRFSIRPIIKNIMEKSIQTAFTSLKGNIFDKHFNGYILNETLRFILENLPTIIPADELNNNKHAAAFDNFKITFIENLKSMDKNPLFKNVPEPDLSHLFTKYPYDTEDKKLGRNPNIWYPAWNNSKKKNSKLPSIINKIKNILKRKGVKNG